MKKPQLITIGLAVLLTAGLFLFGRTVPKKKKNVATEHSADDGHNHAANESVISIDTILTLAKKQLTAEQVVRINTLENSISRSDPAKAGQVVKDQQIHVYHQLARFWADSAHSFMPYAWYTAEAARLENSEKSLTFAAQQILDNLQGDDVTERIKWKALQAKDLFERSLKINPANDSAKVGLGACYLFGSISSTPMEGILKIREVAEKDSTNIYAQMMLARGSLVSGQFDKAITRLEIVNKMKPAYIDAILLLAEVYERMGEKVKAIGWYQKSIVLAKEAQLKMAIEKRIEELKK